MAKALPLYEGMRVNVDHVDPGQRRSLRDRIGLVKNVMLREDGLYADFHFNPKHALVEQIAWDAENAPQNLGFSHDTRGASRNRNGRVVVESIDKVLSVDLVANPATTMGLFEDDTQDLLDLAGQRTIRDMPAASGNQESADMDWKDIDLDGLRKNRPELLTALQESLEKSDELQAMREELKTLKADKALRELQEAIAGSCRRRASTRPTRPIVPRSSWRTCAVTADPAKRKAKIDDRQALVANRRPTAGASRLPLRPARPVPGGSWRTGHTAGHGPVAAADRTIRQIAAKPQANQVATTKA